MLKIPDTFRDETSNETHDMRLGWGLVAIGWLTVIGVIVALSYPYWTIDFATEVYKDTVTNLYNNYHIGE